MNKKRMFLTLICIVTLFSLLCKDQVKANDTVYAKTTVNIRSKPNKNSKSISLLYYGQSVKRLTKLSNGWSKVLYKNKIRYIKSKYLTKNKSYEELGKYKLYKAPTGHHQKSYMDWDCITDRTSQQWKFKQKCYVSKNGVIKYKNRYCVALGSYYCKKIGTKFDLILKNGKKIKCILADQKADKDTDSFNRITSHDGSITEFIVDTSSLNKMSRLMGDISYTSKKWNSEIKYIKVYMKK